MATNLALDESLVEEARRIGHHSTKKAAVTAALEEYVQFRKQLEILDFLAQSTPLRTTTTCRTVNLTVSKSTTEAT